MRARRLSRISVRRGRWAGSGRSTHLPPWPAPAAAHFWPVGTGWPHDALEADGGHWNPGLAKLARVRLALIAQHVGLAGDDQRRRQARQLLGGGAQRGRGDLGAFGLVGAP